MAKSIDFLRFGINSLINLSLLKRNGMSCSQAVLKRDLITEFGGREHT